MLYTSWPFVLLSSSVLKILSPGRGILELTYRLLFTSVSFIFTSTTGLILLNVGFPRRVQQSFLGDLLHFPRSYLEARGSWCSCWEIANYQRNCPIYTQFYLPYLGSSHNQRFCQASQSPGNATPPSVFQPGGRCILGCLEDCQSFHLHSV